MATSNYRTADAPPSAVETRQEMFGSRCRYEDWPWWYWGLAFVLGPVLTFAIPMFLPIL